MATSADEILTVEQVKAELRIPPGTTSQDQLLQSQIESGIAHISHGLPAPLIDETLTVDVEPVRGDSPLAFAAPGLREVTAVKYWSPNGALRLDPDGVIAGADLGRFDAGRPAQVYGPASGWPEVLSGSAMRVVYVRGVAAAKVPAYRAAIVSFVRHSYDGFREVKERESFRVLSRALRL